MNMKSAAGKYSLVVSCLVLALVISTASTALMFELSVKTIAPTVGATSSITVTDNLANDTVSDLNAINSSFTLNGFAATLVGVSSNNPGSADENSLQVQLIGKNSSTTETKQIVLKVTQTDFFGGGNAGAEMTLDSTYGLTLLKSKAGNTITFNSYASPTNLAWGTNVLAGPLSYTSPSSPSTLATSDIALQQTFTRGITPFALTSITTIVLKPNTEVNFSGTTVAAEVPEPSFLGLAAMTGLGLLVRRRRPA